MSRTSIRSRYPGLAAGAVAVVLLTACGGDDDPAADSTAAGATTTAASGDSEFCTEAEGIDQRVDAALSGLDDPDASVSDAFTQVAEELRAIEAPEEIAADWESLASGLDLMAQAFADFDINDSESLAALEEAEGDLSTASGNVEIYLRDECGIVP
jgi:hypothetical protein